MMYVLINAQFCIMTSLNFMLQKLANSISIIRFMVILVNEFCVLIIKMAYATVFKFIKLDMFERPLSANLVTYT